MKKECAYIAEKSKAPVIFGLLAAFSAVWLFVFVLVYDKRIQPVMFFPDNLAAISYQSDFVNLWRVVSYCLQIAGALSLVVSAFFLKKSVAPVCIAFFIDAWIMLCNVRVYRLEMLYSKYSFGYSFDFPIFLSHASLAVFLVLIALGKLKSGAPLLAASVVAVSEWLLIFVLTAVRNNYFFLSDFLFNIFRYAAMIVLAAALKSPQRGAFVSAQSQRRRNTYRRENFASGSETAIADGGDLNAETRPSEDVYKALEALSELKRQGLLEEGEYAAKRDEILKRI